MNVLVFSLSLSLLSWSGRSPGRAIVLPPALASALAKSLTFKSNSLRAPKNLGNA